MAGETRDGRIVLMDLLAENEETGPELQRLVEKVAPGSVAAARASEAAGRVVDARLADIDKRQKGLAAEHNKLATRNMIDDERRKLLASAFAKEHGLGHDDLAAIEKIMLEPDSGLASHLAAARVYVASRIVGAPRADGAEHGIQFPRKDMGEYFKGQGEGRGITDGPNPRQMGEQWARDRAYKDLHAIMNHKPLDPSPYDGWEVDERGHLVGGRR